MEAWKSMVALTVAVVVSAGPAWAQSSTTAPTDKKADTSAPGMMDKHGDKGATGMMDKHGDKASKGGEMKADKAATGDKMSKGGGNVRAAQQALKDKGHDPGPIDGKMGPKTEGALKDFQKAQGLKETGRLDNETMAKLEIKTGAADSATPSASPKTDTGSTSSAPKSDTTSPSASPPTGTTDSTKPAEPKTEEKKQ